MRGDVSLAWRHLDEHDTQHMHSGVGKYMRFIASGRILRFRATAPAQYEERVSKGIQADYEGPDTSSLETVLSRAATSLNMLKNASASFRATLSINREPS